jgi:hypothetical protein
VVEANSNHPPQAGTVPFEQEVEGLGLAAPGAVQQCVGVGLSGGVHRLTSPD